MNGILLVNKPYNWTSAKVVAVVKRLCGGRKTGHGGTLDPAATGLLILGIGEGVKSLDVLLGMEKTYLACLRLGTKTDTGDALGKVIEERPWQLPDRETLLALCEKFGGKQTQLPPMYSAVKVQGKSLYKYARAKQVVQRKPRTVTIHDICLHSIGENGFCLRVHCSKGTYIRTLAEDMGQALGTVAHLLSLERLNVGAFSVRDALDGARLLDPMVNARQLLRQYILPVDAPLAIFPAILVDTGQRDRLRQGQEVEVRHGAVSGLQRLYEPGGSFMGLATACKSNTIRAKRLYTLCSEA